MSRRQFPTSSCASRRGRLQAWWLLLALLPLCSGCGGCRPTPTATKTAAEILKEQEEREKKRREAEKPPIELGPVQILPSDDAEPQFYVKPGHFVSTRQMVRANFEDVQSDFTAATVTTDGNLYELEHVRYQLQLERPAALPKGQAKLIEALYFVPRGRNTIRADSLDRAWLKRTFQPRSGNAGETVDRQPVLPMPDFQYHLIVLAETPDAYGYVRNLHSVKPPEDTFSEETPTIYYRVQIPADLRRGIAVPSQAFAWTSIAYVIWDNVTPNTLSPDQQQSMLDWLHWGGQLIISGPGSLEKLNGSFLEPHLPAARAAGIELRQEDFDELNANWSLLDKKTNQRRDLLVKRASLSGVKLVPAEGATEVPGTSTLVCEGAVGRGRIVITAFPLTDRDVINWGSYESFFHNVLLRRPPRIYQATSYGDAVASFVDRPSLTHDSRLGSGLRYFSRDVAAETADSTSPAPRTDDLQERPIDSLPALPASPPLVASGSDGLLLDLTGYGAPGESGVAGWNDFSAVSNAARDTLQDAAGISIPNASFVWRVIVVYLVVLVPVNWSFFRVLGRVEWAWLTAPILAIVASLVVVRLAQLDIGFARSRTEVATLEIQANYPRAHLTRYTALYTSLSTHYELESEDPTSVMIPFSTEPTYIRRTHDQLPLVTMRRDRLVRMSGFAVESNSTGIVHTEQMYDLQGSLAAVPLADDAWQLTNGTQVALRDAYLLGKSERGEWRGVRIGTVEPQQQLVANLATFATEKELTALWQDSAVLSGKRGEADDVTLGWLRHTATFDAPLAPGDLRLIAWTDEDWPGVTITPVANQSTTRTLILAHLHRGPRFVPKPDANLYSDVRREIKAEDEPEVAPVTPPAPQPDPNQPTLKNNSP